MNPCAVRWTSAKRTAHTANVAVADVCVWLVLLLSACDSAAHTPVPSLASDAGATERPHPAGSETSPEEDAGEVPQPSLVERGEYLVKAVAACGMCHTPRQPDGSFDYSRWLSGVECLIDVDPGDERRGCVHSRNLTNHETGLQNRSDEDIKDMFRKGERPDGKPVHPFMPYWVLGNMRDADADAIVAYLRQVPGVDHMLPPSEPPFRTPDEAAPRWPRDQIPQPRDDYRDQPAALRGRYLAAEVGVCMACHTARTDGDRPDFADAFQGGKQLTSGAFAWSTPSIAPGANGIGQPSPEDLARRVQHAHGPSLCTSQSQASDVFAALSDRDALDIAHFLLSLEPGDRPSDALCSLGAGEAQDAGP